MKTESSNARLKGKNVTFCTEVFECDEILQLDNELGLIQWSLKLMGIWPFWTRFSNVKFFLCGAILAFNVVGCFSGILNVNSDIEQFIECLLYFNVNLATLLKFLIVKYKRRSIEFILRCILDDCSRYSHLSVSCRSRVAGNIKKRKLMTLTLALFILAPVAGKRSFLSMLWSTAYIFSAFAITKYIEYRDDLAMIRELPIFSALPTFVRHSQIFYLALLSGLFGILMSTLVIVTIDSVFAILMIHATNQFIVLSEELKAYREDHLDACYKISKNMRNCKCMRCIIDGHVNILRYTLNFYWYSKFILYKIDSVFSIVHIAVILLSMNLHLFMYCVTSKSMTDASEQIGIRAFKMKWYSFQKTTVRSIVLMTLRSQIPCYVTVAKFINLSLETYTSVLKTSISYASVIIIAREHLVNER
ncbi:odorant receptor 299 [Nasonia vitripennis]|uniref:Odorant receptor n=1 Tax=Nasonia vitripennis TaxID=7425 RepID=A0A7M6UWC3_NASVI|nr:odorant receptor 299 [Nasonia vitripennis]